MQIWWRDRAVGLNWVDGGGRVRNRVPLIGIWCALCTMAMAVRWNGVRISPLVYGRDLASC